MIKVGNTILQVDTMDMLKALKRELYTRGIDRFQFFRLNGDNVQTNCPFHKGGQEKRPSFGVNGEINKCHCFTCGWSGGIDEMISELLGYNDKGKQGRKWLVRSFNTIEIETRPNILEGRLKRQKTKNTQDQAYVTEEELDTYRYIHPYMYERGLTDDIIEDFDIGYDKNKNAITFPILDLNRHCVFVATRSVKTKFFGLPKGLNKPIYQAYRFTGGEYKEAYIVESFLNCLTLWKLGLPAMALIGTGDPYQYRILEQLPVRVYILAFDPDEAGEKATERFRNNVKGKIIKEVKYVEEDKDINDLQEGFLALKKVF